MHMAQSSEIIRGHRPVSADGIETRAVFIFRTYSHLLGAIIAFTLIEIFLFQSGLAKGIASVLLRSWLLVLGGFMIISWLASRAALVSESKAVQYAALAGFVVAEAIIFVPLLYFAEFKAPGTIATAVPITVTGFVGLTIVAFTTRRDFSFLRGLLMWGSLCAIGLIIAGTLFGFQLGTVFSLAMVALAGAAILYDTSNVLHHFPRDRYVGAALQLFASVALMLWYVVRLVSGRD